MNGVYCVPKHGIYKDTPVILFTSTSGVTVIKDSDVYANNNSWVGGINQDLNFKVYIMPVGAFTWVSLN
jgi:hypothetical protein